MATSVFLHKSYKTFILDQIERSPSQGRGMRKRLAEAVGCQLAYISHVLAGDRHFSLEQAEAATRFFQLRQDEAEFFLLLVEQNRAGTTSLRKFLDRQLLARREQYLELRSRLPQGKISDDARTIYYSSWHFQAVRVSLSLPHCRTVAAIAKELHIPGERVNEVMQFLMKNGLVHEEKGQYFSSSARIHLASDSPEITKHHTNWRIHALRSLDSFKPNDFHYSGVVSLSGEDFEKVREILRRAVLEGLEVVKPSKEERLAVMNLDFYGM